ncbi:hypothetical protein BJ912DRAFT_1069806 [Pholiota molesta]|nr:hypothetical protein BJ912DRAFT_1069806 [Pholiota molesta]
MPATSPAPPPTTIAHHCTPTTFIAQDTVAHTQRQSTQSRLDLHVIDWRHRLVVASVSFLKTALRDPGHHRHLIRFNMGSQSGRRDALGLTRASADALGPSMCIDTRTTGCRPSVPWNRQQPPLTPQHRRRHQLGLGLGTDTIAVHGPSASHEPCPLDVSMALLLSRSELHVEEDNDDRPRSSTSTSTDDGTTRRMSALSYARRSGAAIVLMLASVAHDDVTCLDRCDASPLHPPPPPPRDRHHGREMHGWATQHGRHPWSINDKRECRRIPTNEQQRTANDQRP